MGLTVALALRLLIPLTIPRWPLAGTSLSIGADTADILIFNLFGFPEQVGYQRFDKALDVYYLIIQAAVAQTWHGPPRAAATALSLYRLAGVGLFELTGWRLALFVFPNLFEMFFVFKLARDRWHPDYALTWPRITGWLALLLIPKMAQEYALHYARWLDDLNLFDLIEDTWRRLTP